MSQKYPLHESQIVQYLKNIVDYLYYEQSNKQQKLSTAEMELHRLLTQNNPASLTLIVDTSKWSHEIQGIEKLIGMTKYCEQHHQEIYHSFGDVYKLQHTQIQLSTICHASAHLPHSAPIYQFRDALAQFFGQDLGTHPFQYDHEVISLLSGQITDAQTQHYKGNFLVRFSLPSNQYNLIGQPSQYPQPGGFPQPGVYPQPGGFPQTAQYPPYPYPQGQQPPNQSQYPAYPAQPQYPGTQPQYPGTQPQYPGSQYPTGQNQFPPYPGQQPQYPSQFPQNPQYPSQYPPVMNTSQHPPTYVLPKQQGTALAGNATFTPAGQMPQPHQPYPSQSNFNYYNPQQAQNYNYYDPSHQMHQSTQPPYPFPNQSQHPQYPNQSQYPSQPQYPTQPQYPNQYPNQPPHNNQSQHPVVPEAPHDYQYPQDEPKIKRADSNEIIVPSGGNQGQSSIIESAIINRGGVQQSVVKPLPPPPPVHTVDIKTNADGEMEVNLKDLQPVPVAKKEDYVGRWKIGQSEEDWNHDIRSLRTLQKYLQEKNSQGGPKVDKKVIAEIDDDLLRMVKQLN